jgi:hypothetical protein
MAFDRLYLYSMLDAVLVLNIHFYIINTMLCIGEGMYFHGLSTLKFRATKDTSMKEMVELA